MKIFKKFWLIFFFFLILLILIYIFNFLNKINSKLQNQQKQIRKESSLKGNNFFTYKESLVCTVLESNLPDLIGSQFSLSYLKSNSPFILEKNDLVVTSSLVKISESEDLLVMQRIEPVLAFINTFHLSKNNGQFLFVKSGILNKNTYLIIIKGKCQ